jgi:hypothetical protein
VDKAINIIDTYAQQISRALDIVVYSLEGLYEKTVRDMPNMLGLRNFWALTDGILASAMVGVMASLQNGTDALGASLSQSQRDFLAAHVDDALFYGAAYESIGAFLAQARVAYARRLREVIASRAFGVDTFNPNPKIMSRDGRKFDFSEAAYLTVRQTLMDWYNQSLVGYLVSVGSETFAIESNQDAMFDLYPLADYPLVAQELFHPRSDKVVSKHVPT